MKIIQWLRDVFPLHSNKKYQELLDAIDWKDARNDSLEDLVLRERDTIRDISAANVQLGRAVQEVEHELDSLMERYEEAMRGFLPNFQALPVDVKFCVEESVIRFRIPALCLHMRVEKPHSLQFFKDYQKYLSEHVGHLYKEASIEAAEKAIALHQHRFVSSEEEPND